MAAPSFLLSGLLGVKTFDQVLFWGSGSIAGTVKVITTPVIRRVTLIHRDSKKLVRETLSAGDGSYRFDNVAIGPKYQVLADDLQPGGYNAAIADWIDAV